MVNNDRIVPIQRIDLLSLYGTIFKLANAGGDATMAVLPAADEEGNFVVFGNGLYLANQPVKNLDFGLATAATVLFVADYGFEGFKVGGTVEEPAVGSDPVIPDAASLFVAVLSSGDVTVSQITPELA